MIEKKLHNSIVSALRKLSKQSPAFKQVVAEATTYEPTGQYTKKDNKPILLAHVTCAYCSEKLRKNVPQGTKKGWDIDHIDEVGPFKGCYDLYTRRVLCACENLQILCKKCHKKKTKSHNAYLRTGAENL